MMKTRSQRLAGLLLAAHLLILVLTQFSLVGFWTDLVTFIVLLRLSFWPLSDWRDRNWTAAVLREIRFGGVGFLIWMAAGITFRSVFFIDTLSLRTFYFLSQDRRLFTAYFQPVGAYSGGYGHFWITESPRWFPLIEWKVYYEHAVHHDFGHDMEEGQPIDNREVAKAYIHEHVTSKLVVSQEEIVIGSGWK